MADLLAYVSDLHGNSTAGLMPAEGFVDSAGNHYSPNLAQRWSWERWLRYWSEVAELRAKAGKLYIVVNGEIVDGFHHKSTEFLVSTRRDMRALGRPGRRNPLLPSSREITVPVLPLDAFASALPPPSLRAIR